MATWCAVLICDFGLVFLRVWLSLEIVLYGYGYGGRYDMFRARKLEDSSWVTVCLAKWRSRASLPPTWFLLLFVREWGLVASRGEEWKRWIIRLSGCEVR